MHDIDTYSQLVEIMMTEDDESLEDFMLTESEADEVVANLEGDFTLFNYIMLFESLLEQYDIYLFNGWDKASIYGAPKVEKFWVTVNVLMTDETDPRGVARIDGALNQGGASIETLDDGRKVAVFRILKRDLDSIEETNKNRIEKLSIAALEEL